MTLRDVEFSLKRVLYVEHVDMMQAPYLIAIRNYNVLLHIKRDGIFNKRLIANFSTKCASEKISKIRWHLAKILTIKKLDSKVASSICTTLICFWFV